MHIVVALRLGVGPTSGQRVGGSGKGKLGGSTPHSTTNTYSQIVYRKNVKKKEVFQHSVSAASHPQNPPSRCAERYWKPQRAIHWRGYYAVSDIRRSMPFHRATLISRQGDDLLVVVVALHSS